jgi:hypothetical protein
MVTPKYKYRKLVMFPHLESLRCHNLAYLNWLSTREYKKNCSYSHPHKGLQLWYELYALLPNPHMSTPHAWNRLGVLYWLYSRCSNMTAWRLNGAYRWWWWNGSLHCEHLLLATINVIKALRMVHVWTNA